MTAICDSELLTTLQQHFGHQTFRPGQEQLVAAVLSGRDVLAVMPTGSGKSLGYQLPAIVLGGTTLVGSPLIALMKDQVDELNRRGIPSAALHSMLSSDSRREVLNAARAGRLHLLYVAPERFASDSFVRLLGELANEGYGFCNWFLNNPEKGADGSVGPLPLPSTPRSSVTFQGNGVNAVYLDWEHDLVIVVRWIDSNIDLDQFLGKVIAAIAPS